MIQTNPLCGTLSTGELGKRCNTCFLDERELAIVSGKMGEWEQRVGRGLRDDSSTRETNMDGEKEEEGGLKRCMGCKVVRYCSKVSLPLSSPLQSSRLGLIDLKHPTLLPGCIEMSEIRLDITFPRM
jgi:hypothetical protein